VQAAGALRFARGWGSHIFRNSAYRRRQGCQPYAPAAFYHQEDPWVLISVRAWFDHRVIVRLEELSKLKKTTSSGTRSGDLLHCSIVPQPSTLLRAPISFLPNRKERLMWRVHMSDCLSVSWSQRRDASVIWRRFQVTSILCKYWLITNLTLLQKFMHLCVYSR
jgi:hypothetical protein